jgi:glycosyltransferase involved in cell wall biosynthesis
MSALHIAVDARNLAHDWRGIGRYVRAILAVFAQRDDVSVTLVEPGPFGQRAPRGADVVWHPWNGTFFSARVPAVVTFHDAAPFRFPNPDLRKRRSEQQPFVRSAATARAFLANSAFTRAEIETCLGVAAERVTVTPLAVDHAVFTPHGRAAPLADGRAYILFVGAHDVQKNVATLIAAWRAAFPRAGVALAFTRAPAELPAGAVVLDAVTDAQLADAYRGALIAAVPSLYEGFGLPLIEAMACGTPAIASRVAALPEAGGSACAWVDDPCDVAAWADALAQVAGDEPVRAAMRAAGIERAATFSWQRCAEATLAVLHRAAEGA